MKYCLFLDECGDYNLSNYDPDFPVFTLCGILISETDYAKLKSDVRLLKDKYWKGSNVILHSRDIRRCQKGFEILFDLDVKKRFYDDLNKLMSDNNYAIIACVINKEAYIRRYGRLGDVYNLSLSFIMERSVFFLDAKNDAEAELSVIAEKRGKKEDDALLAYYNKVFSVGTYYVKTDRIKRYFKKIDFIGKSKNVTGLQISDLIAYPVTRHVINKDEPNLAYEMIKGKFYSNGKKRFGLKTFP